MVTSNLPFDEWTEIFGSERLTGALLDRLTHHVHILEMNGERLSSQPKPKTAEIPKYACLTTELKVDPVGPQEPPRCFAPRNASATRSSAGPSYGLYRDNPPTLRTA